MSIITHDNNLKDKLETLFKIRIFNIYGFGSVYYGTFREGVSDMDLIVIADLKNLKDEEEEVQNDTYNIHFVTRDRFLQHLNAEQNFTYIEAWFHPIYEEEPVNFIFNKEVFDRTVSYMADRAYDRAKKKLTLEAAKATSPKEREANIYLAKKNLFHSIRLLDFAIQIYNNQGKIVNWTHLAGLYNEIMQLPNDSQQWDVWNTKYKKMFNTYKSQFRAIRK